MMSLLQKGHHLRYVEHEKAPDWWTPAGGTDTQDKEGITLMVADGRITLQEGWHAVDKDHAHLDGWVEAPRWVRIVLLANSRVQPNGHAPFAKGELAELLQRDGETPNRRVLYNAIQRAVDLGLLQPGSIARCLIPVGVQRSRGGNFGDCPRKHPAPRKEVDILDKT